MRLIAILCLFLLFTIGCEQNPGKAGAPATAEPPQRRLQKPLEPVAVELPTAALPVWRQHRQENPALVMLTFDPFLKPIPAPLSERARDLVGTGTLKDITRHGSYWRADPVILPAQTLSAALEAGLFSRIDWIFPSKVPPEQLEVARFREQMIEAEFLTPAEAEAVTLTDGIYTGTVRGIPFRAVHHQRFTELPESSILHIDLSYFRGLYDNEIKTPLYDLLHQTAGRLLKMKEQPLGVTLSYSTIEGAISLDTRFLLHDLAATLRDPQMLDKAMPKVWGNRAQALYAADMFTESKKLELYRESARLAPEDPTAVYDLFQAHFLAKELEPALQALDRTVALDPGYGAAYLDLAQMALEDGQAEIALDLQEKAAAVFPLNPFIDLQRADLLLQLERRDEARALIAPLQELDWSVVYHEGVPATLTAMAEAASAERAMDEKAAGKAQ